MSEPLHISAAMAALSTLRDTFQLPHPAGVRFTKSNSIAVVDVSTFGEVATWAQALHVPDGPRSSAHTDGSATHGVWVQWNGWDLRVVAHVDAPAEVPERTMFSHCNWIGGCDTELTTEGGSLLCREHVEAPLAEAVGHYVREFQRKGFVPEHGEAVTR